MFAVLVRAILVCFHPRLLRLYREQPCKAVAFADPTVVSSCVLDIGRAMEVTELSTCNETSVCPPVVYRRPDKETVLQRNFVVGRVITFQCDVGFSLSGKQSLTCLDGGQWNGSIVSCTSNSYF